MRSYIVERNFQIWNSFRFIERRIRINQYFVIFVIISTIILIINNSHLTLQLSNQISGRGHMRYEQSIILAAGVKWAIESLPTVINQQISSECHKLSSWAHYISIIHVVCQAISCNDMWVLVTVKTAKSTACLYWRNLKVEMIK